MTDPLVVNPEIELPQLDISNNFTEDCTNQYSTGVNIILFNYYTYENNTHKIFSKHDGILFIKIYNF